MTSVRITDDSVQVSFAQWEKLLGLVRDITLPLASIRCRQLVSVSSGKPAVRICLRQPAGGYTEVLVGAADAAALAAGLDRARR